MLAICFAVGVLAAACTASDNCVDGKCETVSGTEICTQCKATYVPINGKCALAADSQEKCKNADDSAAGEQTCGKCKGQTFMFKGGCYDKGAAPGNLICTDGISGGTNGVCTTCKEADGFFRNPDAADTTDSCILCNDTTGVTVGTGNTKTYTGITNCAKCTAPNQITGGSGAQTAAATCTECASNLYLKIDSGTTSCVTSNECTGGFFPMTDAVDSKKVCVSCGTADKGGIGGCSVCELLASTTKASTVLISCSACSTNNLSPLKNECMQNCPAGMYADSNRVCLACHTSCASCKDNNAESSCTACYPGHVLSKGAGTTKGTCIKECTGAFMTHCKANSCTLDVGGSKYCDACEDGYAPIDGVCTAIAEGARDASGCKANDGKCTACTSTYALLSGGCYNTKALPGSAVCTAANSGSCTTCANGQTYASGNCPACAEGCAKCQSSTSTCTECLAGYYLDSTASKCVKCSENSADGTIQGVKDCVSCTAPSGNSGPVTCYVTQAPAVDPTNPSVNKGGLSSGAIAGISVAVIVVVGGLVGFLCWWFVCRGKA
ncbi:Variant-specific surface protein [Giardia duodenalis]|uniref:Variant-specific surface protein n=1 Tax=Giardia intestinalis TaxID=5741 RepID=V6TQV9_GIAIN|nr:Variant-specific surface protein [Giardia intestinalis]